MRGVPEEHRTDSLSAAFNNLAEQEALTQRYDDLCRHYGLRATRCNPCQSNENRSIESRHASLKTALDQAQRLRGSRSFDVRSDYEALVDAIVQRMAAQKAEREACKTMVGLLVLAAEGHEAQLAQKLEQLIELDQLPDLNALTQLLAPPKSEVPQVAVILPT